MVAGGKRLKAKDIAMFGRKGLGQATPATQHAPSPPQRGHGEGFNHEPAQGERRTMPPQPRAVPEELANGSAQKDAMVRRLVEGLREVRSTTDQLTAVAACSIGPLHLLPPELWEGRLGPVLLLELDLSPYRPWNTIYLPSDAEGAFALGLAVLPQRFQHDFADVEAMIDMILDLFAGRDNPEAQALAARLASIRQNFPALFPTDRADLPAEARQARANIRSLAFVHATDSRLIDAEAIISSHETFLVDPGTQLTS
jgi:hypothetical protein